MSKIARFRRCHASYLKLFAVVGNASLCPRPNPNPSTDRFHSLPLEVSGNDSCWGWYGSGTGNEWKRSVLGLVWVWHWKRVEVIRVGVGLGLGLSPEYISMNDKELGENKE